MCRIQGHPGSSKEEGKERGSPGRALGVCPLTTEYETAEPAGKHSFEYIHSGRYIVNALLMHAFGDYWRSTV